MKYLRRLLSFHAVCPSFISFVSFLVLFRFFSFLCFTIHRPNYFGCLAFHIIFHSVVMVTSSSCPALNYLCVSTFHDDKFSVVSPSSSVRHMAFICRLLATPTSRSLPSLHNSCERGVWKVHATDFVTLTDPCLTGSREICSDDE